MPGNGPTRDFASPARRQAVEPFFVGAQHLTIEMEEREREGGEGCTMYKDIGDEGG